MIYASCEKLTVFFPSKIYFIGTNAVSQFLHTFVYRLVHDVVHSSHRLQIDKQIFQAYHRFASHLAFELHDKQKVGDFEVLGEFQTQRCLFRFSDY